jgi:hypothetical protein
MANLTTPASGPLPDSPQTAARVDHLKNAHDQLLRVSIGGRLLKVSRPDLLSQVQFATFKSYLKNGLLH